MTRFELYERVWQTPMTRLAAELNLSDVGLAKLCRSSGIPRPAVGHWAKVAAGAGPKRPALTGDPQERITRLPTEQERAARALDAAKQRSIRSAGRSLEIPATMPHVELRSSLDGCLPIVARTARFFAAIPGKAEHYEARRQLAKSRHEPFWGSQQHEIPRRITGRFNSSGEGRLSIAATLSRVDQILRFHDALLRALVDRGCKIATRKNDASDSYRVEIKRGRGVLIMSFTEGYEKSSALAGRWDSALPDTGYRAKDTMRLKARWEHGVERKWEGTLEHLEVQLPNVVWDLDAAISRADADLPGLLAARAEAHRRMEEEWIAEERRRESARQEKLRNEREAAWVDRAFAAADMHLRLGAVEHLLNELERRAPGGTGGDRVRDWLSVVRSRIRSPVDMLLEELLRELRPADST